MDTEQPANNPIEFKSGTQPSYTKTGGARIGWVNATYPFARLTATPEKLVFKVSILGTYTFMPEQVVAIERYVRFPVIASGIRVKHLALDCPQKFIFWSQGSPEEVLTGIQNAGFVPVADPSAAPVRRGFPVRWSAILATVVVWNVLFTIPFIGRQHPPAAPDCLAVFPLFAACALAIGVLKSPLLQRLILKPGRSVGEIQAFLRLLAFICGLLAIIFSILIATSAFNPSPKANSVTPAAIDH